MERAGRGHGDSVRVSLARFFSRAQDAIGPLLKSSIDLERHLLAQHVALTAADILERHPVHIAGFMLLVNLCARLYPKLSIVCSPRVYHEASVIARQINPSCEIGADSSGATASLSWGPGDDTSADVRIDASGWNVFVNTVTPEFQPTNVLASLAAGAIGAGEIFRRTFRAQLGIADQPSPAATLNILTLDDSNRTDLPDLPASLDLGRVHLVGAGAIGQAAVYALARIDVRGTIVVIDPEEVTLSNLQRYVLSGDRDVGASKTAVAEHAMRTSQMKVRPIKQYWMTGLDGPIDTVCVAVDSEATRIAIQAALPRRVYNAWTQPADVGWSRHEVFGEEPCLACLYWPTRPRPSHHQLIAWAVHEHEARVLGYLTSNVPVDAPLTQEHLRNLANMPLPPDAGKWTTRAILDDIAQQLGMDASACARWRGKQLSDLYREGICGGAIVSTRIGQVSQEVIVPVAHQSALAGIMLVSSLVIGSSPELTAYRPRRPEARLDVLASLPQVAVRPRQRTPGCICSDSDFLKRFHEKWGQTEEVRAT